MATSELTTASLDGLAQSAYDAYVETVGDIHDGWPLPPYKDLPVNIKNAWRAAVKNVVDNCVKQANS